MSVKSKKNHIQIAMDTLGVNASELTRASGVDTSLINKWRRGDRKMTKRSAASVDAAKTLVILDKENVLEELYAPYRSAGANDAQALLAYLMDEDISGLDPQAKPPKQQKSGIYTAQYRVYLGKKGFRQAGLDALDYAMHLPPSEFIVLAQGRYEWFTGSITYLLRFLRKLKKVLYHGTRLQMVNRRGYTIGDTPAFAGPWMAAHLKGLIRSYYYDGELPKDIRLVASIKGYWSLRAEEDPEMEDNLYLAMKTDLRETRRDTQLCEEYLARSKSASQYSFFQAFSGDDENPKLWHKGPLPAWESGDNPNGSLNAITCVPGVGLITRKEFLQVAGTDPIPDMPDYLFPRDSSLSKGKHRIILCREDIKAGLKKERRQHEVLSAILHRRAFVTKEMLSMQLQRLIEAMQQNEDFEVALVPKTAFKKLQFEMVCWRNSVTVGWLSDVQESILSTDMTTSRTLLSSIDFTWDKMLANWKRKSTALRNLRKWLAGQELDNNEEDSAIVQNWDILPREK